MIDYADKELFQQDSLPKNLIVTYDNVTLQNSDIVSESLEVVETLCDEENIVLGSCCASQVKFRIGYISQSLIGKEITVSIQPQGGEIFQIGKYIIDSDRRTADRRYKDIVAYDVLKTILESDVIDWYNAVLPQIDSTVTLKQFRDSFFTHFGVEQESISLINDTMTVEKTFDAERLSGSDVITKICEINACFGHIGRDGKFHYIYLENLIPTLYPAEDLYPREDLYPSDGEGVTLVGENGTYINCDYEDFVTAKIDKLQIRQEEDDIGKIVGTGTNCYVIQDNFLVYGKTDAQLTNIATPIFNRLQNIQYMPSTIEVVGNPCFEVGDGVQVATRYNVVFAYILKRTLKGIQALRDTYEASGNEYLPDNVNSVNSQIIQLRGRTNKLVRTVDETISELEAYEEQTDGTLTRYDSRITQNAQSITSEVTRAKGAENTLSSRITQTAESITSEVEARQQGDSATLSTARSEISQSASTIRSEVSATYETKTNAGTQYRNLSSSIEQNAQAITTKVTNGEISSKISQEAGQVSLSADRLVVDSSYFKLDSDGEGSLGGLSFDANGFYSKELDAIVLQVHPNPANGWALSVGTSATFRAFLIDADTYYLVNYQGSYPFAIGHEGEVYVTNLQVKNEYSRSGPAGSYVYSKTSEGRLHVDDYISCWGNIEIGTRDVTSDPTRSSEEVRSGSLYVRKSLYDSEGKTGNVVADNYITALGYGTGSGDIEAAHDLIYGNACYQSSDRNLKKDIKTLDEKSVEFIYGLNPVEYRFKDNDEKLHHGLIAQELPADETRELVKRQRNGYLSIAYTELIADLIKTVQSQNERITALEKRIAKLEGN